MALSTAVSSTHNWSYTWILGGNPTNAGFLAVSTNNTLAMTTHLMVDAAHMFGQQALLRTPVNMRLLNLFQVQ